MSDRLVVNVLSSYQTVKKPSFEISCYLQFYRIIESTFRSNAYDNDFITVRDEIGNFTYILPLVIIKKATADTLSHCKLRSAPATKKKEFVQSNR